MKTLYVLRHAKASWKDSDLPDPERPLNGKGRFQADALSDYLAPLLPPPGRVVCSSAARATQTLDYFLEVWPLPSRRIRMTDELYLADQESLLEVIRGLADADEVVMLVGHNPGLTDLVQTLGSERGEYVKNIKTCGFVQIDFTVDHWKDVAPGLGDVKLNLRPKDIRDT